MKYYDFFKPTDKDLTDSWTLLFTQMNVMRNGPTGKYAEQESGVKAGDKLAVT